MIEKEAVEFITAGHLNGLYGFAGHVGAYDITIFDLGEICNAEQWEEVSKI